MLDFRELFKAGVHFGHQKARWNPKMKPYIWGFKNNVHLIDVSKTAHQLEKAAKFLEETTSGGKSVLFVGTKKPAQDVMREAADKLKMPYVTHRWIGGTLSNNSQVKKSITKLMHFEDIIDKSDKVQYYTKKEVNVFQKMVQRLKKNIGGIRKLTLPLGALIVVDVRKERSAIKEAKTMGIPVVALVDTNGDPSDVDYVIPTNDDVPRSIKVIVDYLAAAIERGRLAATKKAEAVKAARAEKALAKKTEAKATAPKKAVAKPVAKPAVKPAIKKVEAKAAPKVAVKTEKKAEPKKVAKETVKKDAK